MSLNNAKVKGKKKDDQWMHSANPELWAKANKPTSTIAMGMKSNQLSSECWRNQVQREKQIAAEWKKKYKSSCNASSNTEFAFNDMADLNNSKSKTEISDQDNDLIAALQNTQACEAAAHKLYIDPLHNPELHNILYNDANNALMLCNEPLFQNNHPSGKDDVCHVATAVSVANPSLERKTLSTWEQQGLPATQLYLKARVQNHKMHERYPQGPSTSSQVIGWSATKGQSHADDIDIYRIDPDLYKPYQQHQSNTFHRPDDKDHALLFGYDFVVK